VSRVTVEWRAAKAKAEISAWALQGMERACQFAAERAREYAPASTGTLRSEITYEVRAYGDVVEGAIGLPRKAKAFYARWVELGTAGHLVKVRRKRVLSDRETVFGRLLEHPGIRAHPFLRPAVFNHATEILRLIGRRR